MTGRVVEIFAARHRVEPLMTRGNGERGGLKTRGRKIKAFPSRPTRTGWRRSTAAFLFVYEPLSLFPCPRMGWMERGREGWRRRRYNPRSSTVAWRLFLLVDQRVPQSE